MKDTLLEIQSKFGRSKPVFTGKLDSSGYGVEFTCAESYDPQTADLDHSDPVVQLMVEGYSERFDKQDFFQVYDNKETIARRMFDSIRQAFKQASPLKNPVQSKLYKWLDFNNMNSLHRREGIISLYRYVFATSGDDFRFKDGSDNPHAKNLVAILEKMKEKYE